MVEGKKRTIFAVLNHEAGRGPARLRRLVWDQEIAGSNPAAPTLMHKNRNLVQTETFFHYLPLRQANMVFMVDSEPHR